ncbi:MAG: hypothetical protein B6244_10210 [Candidatus Cloacimonetes bacterium 4572_55]|nr:MAG: hypothetical protein B6244_10210 [Candidatus Cloacimonetes bacterium 4572_55]
MPKIKELIELPMVETVIQLRKMRDLNDEYDSAASFEHPYTRGLAESFVLTEDIETNLLVIMQVLSERKGRGFFLTGSFGAGKSHFLSVLSLLVQSVSAKSADWIWFPLIRQQQKLKNYRRIFSERRYLTVEIPLLSYQARRGLEEILFDAIQTRLSSSRFQIDTDLAEESYFLRQFKIHILPLHEHKLDRVVQKKYPGMNTWKRLLNNNRQAAYRLTKEYLAGLPEKIPFRMSLDREEGFDRLDTILDKHGFDGVIFLIDELSEFLKSKKKESLNEDARFLQYIGERSATRPLWIVAALQEHIEKTGDIQKAVIDKIKDRYHTHLSLSTRHVRELIDHRLIIKKKSASKHIREAYRQLKFSFNNIPMKEDEFIEIYPIHPETLEVLDLCADLFSQRRGTVDFIHHQVKGDPSRRITGILEEDFTNLLTPDRVFDHFEDRLRDSPQLRKYYELYHEYFYKRIHRLFSEDKSDALHSLRLIKILILLKISDIQSQRTLRQLAHMLLYQALSGISGGVNYDYLSGHLIQKMIDELSYLRLTSSPDSDDPLDAVLEIDPETTTVDIFSDSIRTIRRQAEKMEMISALLRTVSYGSIPLAQFLDKSDSWTVNWMNSERRGLVRLIDLTQITNKKASELIGHIRTSEDDFVLMIGYPLQIDAQREHVRQLFRFCKTDPQDRFAKGIIAWIPTPFTEDDLLRDWYGYSMLAKKYARSNHENESQQAQELSRMAESKLGSVESLIRSSIQACYRKGEFLSPSRDFSFDFPVSAYKGFEDLLGLIVDRPLKALYPNYHEIRTMVNLSTSSVNELITEFVVPGQVDSVHLPHRNYLRGLIHGAAEPLRLVRSDPAHRSVRLKVAPEKSVACRIVLERVNEEMNG